MKSHRISDDDLLKIKETHRREYETSLKENDFWLNGLQFSYFHGENPLNLIHYHDMIDHLTAADIQEAAKQYLNRDNYVMVVLYPEDSPNCKTMKR